MGDPETAGEPAAHPCRAPLDATHAARMGESDAGVLARPPEEADDVG
jgi:hypothetical protein